MPVLDDTDFVARLRAGDNAAYERLVHTHAGALNAVARRFFGDTLDATEAVQDAFVSAFKAMGTFEGAAQLGTWLHRILVNACLLKLRARKRHQFAPLDDAGGIMANTGDTLARGEARARVREGLGRLPAAYRAVIQLRDLDGLSTEEAAARLGTNDGVVKTRLHRARQALKTVLEPYFANAV